jgi:hypothetical protein
MDAEYSFMHENLLAGGIVGTAWLLPLWGTFCRNQPECRKRPAPCPTANQDLGSRRQRPGALQYDDKITITEGWTALPFDPRRSQRRFALLELVIHEQAT